MGESRSPRRKKHRGLKILIFLIIILLVVGLYSYFQYKSGLEEAQANSTATEDIAFTPDLQKDQDIENILVIGIDTRGEAQSRSDTMMLVTWNKATNDIRLTSFMRDIYAEIPGYQSYKLNTAYYLGGVSLLQQTLKSMFEVEINHYAVIDFKNFEKLVDVAAPDGVEIDVKEKMSKNIGVTLEEGKQRLNGKELLGYARFRYNAEGDFGRVARQQEVIEALKTEILSPKNIKNYPKLLGAIQGYVQTDILPKDQLKMMLGAVRGGGVTTEKLTIPVKDTYSFVTYPGVGSSIVIDQQKNIEAIEKFLTFD